MTAMVEDGHHNVNQLALLATKFVHPGRNVWQKCRMEKQTLTCRSGASASGLDEVKLFNCEGVMRTASQRGSIDPWKWSTSYGYSQAVRAGNLVFISGQMPVDGEGKLVGPGDIEAQARQVFANLSTVLKAADLAVSDLVEIISYHVDMRDLSKVSEIKSAYIKSPYPAWTAVGVTSLALPGQLLEIRATALAS